MPGAGKTGAILLVNLPYYDAIFAKAKARSAVSRGTIPLGLASVAAPLVQAGKQVSAIDLNLSDTPDRDLHHALMTVRPAVVGITATTPLIGMAGSAARAIRKALPGAVIVAGGPHPSALPEEVLLDTDFDVAVIGEGESALLAIAEDGVTEITPNIVFKKNGALVRSTCFQSIADLDTLPFPAYEIFDISKYRMPSIVSKRSPVAYLETSRGCFGQCVYCHKVAGGYAIRYKSAGRVVDEMERAVSLGFREVHIVDDNFTADLQRAYAICEEILRRGLKLPWYPRGGVRVDRITPELLKIMKRAGCYRIPFGVESGSQKVLDAVKKNISLEQAVHALKAAKAAGHETECYFMLGLPGETEEDLVKTREFAILLDPDFVKFTVAIPLPGTPMFDEMHKKRQLLTMDWSKYNFSTPVDQIYRHDSLTGEQLQRHSATCFRAFYFRPSYVMKMLYKSLCKGTFWGHFFAFCRTRW